MADDTLEKDEGSIPIRLREDEELDFFTELALHEVERWIQAVTRKKFEYTDDFRKSLSNGILLCELLNTLQPGSVKRINKLPGPIAGLDNVNVFLAACEKNFGLNKTQLFDSSDLEDLSNRAISDQNEYYLKQEVDRRARNVAITIFWLGKAVAGTFKGPALDASAFAALVHSHGNKNIISDDCFKNETTLTKENNRVTGSTPHTHIRDSSYDSLGSYERESESSFDELDGSGNMPVRSDMKEMRRYGSASSLSMPRDLRLTSGDSMYSDDNKNDSMYVSSPDLSQGSHAHTRSSSTDSEGNFYGNHSRQSSGSTDHHPGRRTSTSNLRRTSTSTPDPLQFVKLKGANELAENAKKIIEATKEVNIMRNKVDTGSVSEEPDWQSNFNNWKSRRKSTHTRIGDEPFEETMEEERKQHKTFGQILAEKENRENRRSLGPMNIYPLDDNDNGIGLKSSQESPISKTTGSRMESKPKGNKSKGSDVAPWAHDSSEDNISQSDSETNNSHQSGDTDSVFSDKSNPSKVLSDDDSWVKNKVNAQMVSNKITPPLRTQRSLGDTMKLWENNANESQKKDNKKVKDLPANSAKIRNITQAFEQKEKEANTAPVTVKRSEYARSKMSKSLDLSDRSFSTPLSPVDKKPPSPLSPTAAKALIPKEQQFSTGDSQLESQLPDNSNKVPPTHSCLGDEPPSVSENVRYLPPVFPSVSKPTMLTSAETMVTKKSPPQITSKPSRSKIAAARALFEQQNAQKDSSIGYQNDRTTKEANKKGENEMPVKENREADQPGENEIDDRKLYPQSVVETNSKNDVADDEFETETLLNNKSVFEINVADISGKDKENNNADMDKIDNSITDVFVERGRAYKPSVGSFSGNDNGTVKNKDLVNSYQTIETGQHFIDIGHASSKLSVINSDEDKEETANDAENQQEVFGGDFSNQEAPSRDFNNQEDTSRGFNNHPDDVHQIAWQIVDSILENVKNQEVYTPRMQLSIQDIENDTNESHHSHTKRQDSKDSSLHHAKHTDRSPITKLCDRDNNNMPVEVTGDQDDECGTSPYDESFESPRPPALPTSSVPDIISSNLVDKFPQDTNMMDASFAGTQSIDGLDSCSKKFTEQTIKINQKPNNEKGFGFVLVGGVEKKQPVTVQKVSLGTETSDSDDVFIDDTPRSAADVCEVEANDELISINGRDVTTLTLAQVQGIVDHSVKRGQIELRVKRYLDEDQNDSVEDNAFMENKASVKTSNNNNNNNNNNNTMDAELNSLSESPDKHGHIKPTVQMSSKSDEPPRLMDQLIEEQQREAIHKQNLRAPSPEPVETFTPEVVLNTHSAPLQLTSLEQQQTTNTSHDMRAPDDVTIAEERSTISKRRSPINAVVQEDEPVVQMRKPKSLIVYDSPLPPTPPKSELPPLASYQDTPGGENSGFGPPAALLRWQRPRPKSEYQAPISSPHTQQPSERTKRMSATLPYNADSKFTLDKDYSKDDSMMDKVTKHFEGSVSMSKPADNKPSVNRFNDTSRFEEWEQKQEEQRMPEERSSTPPIEINIHKEEHLTAQSAAPARKQPQIEAPSSAEITIPIPDYSGQAPLSPQEKFERDQQRIRLQYEEEKRQAKEVEKRKQEQEKKTLNADKFMRDMESQILQTKQEAANHHIGDIEPIKMSDTTPKFNSEPMTIRLSSNMPGRQLIIDPRNQTDVGDSMLPEYSFRVDLPKTESAPPLRTLDTGPSQEEILAREREKIREEEKRKFEEEQKRWKKEQEQKEQRLRQEQENIERQRQKLKEEQEQMEREKALLEQKTRENDSYTSPYQPVNIQTYISPRSSAGSSGSPMSHSPKSPPALDPKYRESQSKKAAPPTAPKPDKGTKARLTRDDLLAMNRKATPLTKPEPLEHTASIGDNPLSPSTREPPSKGELHSLNAVPKQKFRSSAAWIKDEDVENDSPDERPFVIGKRSDLIHQRDYSNPSDHWLVREAEKRRLADSNSDYTNRRDNSDSVTARAGPTKPSQSSLVSRFRGDVEPPPRTNRLSYPYSQSLDLHHSPKARPASTAGTSSRQYDRSPEPSTQFSAKTQPNSHAGNPSLSQTLPPNFSFSANARNQDGLATKPPRSLSTDDSGPVIAVSGKQKCSHCGEELGFGAAMVIESLGLYYHVQCFRCCVCRMPLGNGSEGTDVRVRVNKLHCKNCYSNDEAGLKFSKV